MCRQEPPWLHTLAELGVVQELVSVTGVFSSRVSLSYGHTVRAQVFKTYFQLFAKLC